MPNHRLTFAEHREAVRPDANTHLFRRASTANAMAKITCGESRRIAYRVKHISLHQFITRGHGLVRPDRERCPGLLSVELDARHRLHTHESWLRDAVAVRQLQRS